MLIYYVYAYVRENGTPYYIGKGKGNRAFIKHGRVKLPPQHRIIFLEKNLSNIGACAIERRMIAWYGKKVDKTGILLNLTDGGEGNTAKRSREWSDDRSRVLKELWKNRTPAERKFAVRGIVGCDRSYMKKQDYRDKISRANKGKSRNRQSYILDGKIYDGREALLADIGISMYNYRKLPAERKMLN